MDLKCRGWYPRDNAEAFDVSEEAVSRWLARARDDGPEALRVRPTPGRSPRLTPIQASSIPELLWHGSEAYGFRGQAWTYARVAKVIEWEFGVRYHKDHVGRMLKGLGWTPQQPIRRAIQRDDEAIRRWREEIWPGPRRRAIRERRTLVFEDDSGFYLLPGLVRTYAPDGCTPVIREEQARDRLSVMGGMPPRPSSTHSCGRSRSTAARRRVPDPSGTRGGGATAGDLVWLADPPPGGGQGLRRGHARPGGAGGAAGVRPRSEPVG